MEQIITGVSAQTSPFHARAAAAATVADILRPPPLGRGQRILRLPVAAFNEIGLLFPPRNRRTGPWAHIAVVQGALAMVHEEIHAGPPQDEPAGLGTDDSWYR